MRIRGWLLLLLVPILAASPARPAQAEDDRGDPLPRMEDAKDVAVRVLQVRLHGQALGSVRFRTGRPEEGGLLRESHFRVRMLVLTHEAARRFAFERYTLEYQDADGRLAWRRTRQTDPKGVWSGFARFGDGHVQIRSDRDGSQAAQRLAIPADHMTDGQAFLAVLDRHRRGEGARLEYQHLERGRFESHAIEILDTAVVKHAGREHEGFLVKGHFLAPRVILDADGLPLRIPANEDGMEGIWTDEAAFEQDRADLTLESVIPVRGVAPTDPPLAELELHLTFERALPEGTSPVRDGRYQRAVPRDDGFQITLRSTRLPEGHVSPALPMEGLDPDVARCLEPTPACQSEDEDIVARAQEIVGEADDARVAADRIVAWVHDALSGRPKPATYTAADALSSRTGDCKAHSVLVVALCRAAGIPARRAWGFLYTVPPVGDATASGHAWAEVWLGAWMGVDATVPELGTTARYLQAGESGSDEDGGMPDYGWLLLGGPRLAVEAYRPVGGARVVLGQVGERDDAPSSWPVASIAALAAVLVAFLAVRAVRRRRARAEHGRALEATRARLRRPLSSARGAEAPPDP